MPIPDPVAFAIFGLEVKWYGIIIAFAMVVAVFIMYRRAPKHNFRKSSVLDFAIVVIPAGVVGARLYYVFFNWDTFKNDPLSIVNLRTGGLAIHGGLIFALIAIFIFCRVKKISTLNVLDLIMPAVILAQSIGRWGNYFNSEAHGGPTDLPWAVTVNGQTYHPTFLYESVWCFIVFLILIYADNRRKFTGQVFLLYGIFYSFERFFVEWIRTDSLMIGSLKQAQVLSAAVFLSFTVIYIFLSVRGKSGKKGRKKRL